MKKMMQMMLAVAMLFCTTAVQSGTNDTQVASKGQRQVSFPYVGQQDATGC